MDFMHLIFENLGDIMYKHWSGSFWGNTAEKDPYEIHKDNWKEIGDIMTQCRKAIPSSFGRPPRDITKHVGGWKAEEWQNWIVLYSMPILVSTTGSDFAIYLRGWAKLVRAVQLCIQPTITLAQVQEVRQLFVDFVQHYEDTYYQRKRERLSACTSIIHYLLHITDSIEQFGPVTSYWQYPMERVCGQLGPLVKSTVYPYENLSNNIIFMESLIHARFASNLPSLDKPLKTAQPSPTRVLCPADYNEELYGPSRWHQLSIPEQGLLQRHYGAIVSEKPAQIDLEKTEVLKYSVLRTKDGHIVGSKWSLTGRDRDFARNNSRIIARMQVDKMIHRPAADPQFEERTFTGEVQFFFAHRWRNQTHMMAMVSWSPKTSTDQYGLISFPSKGYRISEVIDVRVIDRLAAWLTIGGRVHLIDEESVIKVPRRGYNKRG
jgi:hypothetical protein